MKFLILGGPNVNLYTYHEPGTTGEMNYEGLVRFVGHYCDQLEVIPDFYQSNHEGALIDEIQSAPGRVDGILINPGGLAYSSVALLDALRLCSVPAVEVMPDDLREMEPFRKNDFVALGCRGHFIGGGPMAYVNACVYLLQLIHIDERSAPRMPM